MGLRNLSILSLLLFIPLEEATFAIDFNEEFNDCENGKPLPAIDATEFEIIPQSDGSLTVNGTIRFIKDYNHPISWNIYTKRLERGDWVPGIISRDIPNLCPVLQIPYEPWYPYTRLMQRKRCPYKAGHVEHMNNVNVGNLATSLQIPPDFIGEWRVYHVIQSSRSGKTVEECFMVTASILEV